MNLIERIRTIEKRLRVMLLATVLLFVPQIGQLAAIRDINTTGQMGNLALFFMFTAVFIVPTSLILTAAIIMTIRKHWRKNERLAILGLINALIALNLTWFFIHQCSWSQVFGLTLRGCQS